LQHGVIQFLDLVQNTILRQLDVFLPLEHQKMNRPANEQSYNCPQGLEPLAWFISNSGAWSLQPFHDTSLLCLR